MYPHINKTPKKAQLWIKTASFEALSDQVDLCDTRFGRLTAARKKSINYKVAQSLHFM